MKYNFLCATHLLFELVHATPFNIEGSAPFNIDGSTPFSIDGSLLAKKTTKQSNDPCTYDTTDGQNIHVSGTWQKIGACPRERVSIDFYYPDRDQKSDLRCCVPAKCSPPYNQGEYQNSYCSNRRLCPSTDPHILKGQCFNVQLDNGRGINDAHANAGCCAPKTKDDGTNSVDVNQKTNWWDNLLDDLGHMGDDMNERLQQPKLVPEKKKPSSSIDSDPNPVASVPEVPLADFSDTTPNVATPNPFGDSSSIVAAPINNGNTYIAGLPALSSDDLFSGDAYAEPLPHFSSTSSPGTSPGQGSSESNDAPA